MRVFIFPRGQTYHAPSDPLGQKLVEQILCTSIARDRLTEGVYRTVEPGNPLGLLQEALALADAAEPIEKRIRVEGIKTGRVTALDLPGQIQQAVNAGILSQTEAAMLRDYDRRVMDLVHVDDFNPEELAAAPAIPQEDRRAVRVSNA
jgi:acyl-CoA dehydrogenase